MMWADLYIGTPFARRGRTAAACDCWGLHRLIMTEQRGREVPAFSTVADAQGSGRWRQVDKPQAFDCVLMRGQPCHVGTMIDAKRMIHVEKGAAGAVISALGDIAVRNRVLSFWRLV
jgi:cell wall-associated NlpC family hydrolase